MARNRLILWAFFLAVRREQKKKSRPGVEPPVLNAIVVVRRMYEGTLVMRECWNTMAQQGATRNVWTSFWQRKSAPVQHRRAEITREARVLYRLDVHSSALSGNSLGLLSVFRALPQDHTEHYALGRKRMLRYACCKRWGLLYYSSGKYFRALGVFSSGRSFLIFRSEPSRL